MFYKCWEKRVKLIALKISINSWKSNMMKNAARIIKTFVLLNPVIQFIDIYSKEIIQ